MQKAALILFIVILTLTMITTAQEPGSPIPLEETSASIEAFIGSAAVPQPIEAPAIPPHPFMASSGQSNTHNDAYMSDTYVVPGPLGASPQVLSSSLGGICVTMAFDQQGRIISACIDLDSAQLYLIDPVTLAPLAVLDLPAEDSGSATDFVAGSYFYLDHNDHVLLPTIDRTIWELAVVEEGFEQVQSYDLSTVIPETDSIGSVLPDFSGRLWFVTQGGLVGTLEPETGMISTLQLEGEVITNSFAVDETGGVFINSDHAMYRFDAGASGEPVITWREEYDRGSQIKPGQVSQGSGTTPTLMGDEYVTIADNAEPQMHVLVYRRSAEITGDRLVCQVPVFEEGASATENSLIATDSSIIVENNYGYDVRSILLGGVSSPGMARIDVQPDGGCEIAWTSDETIPSLISKLSLATGLIYTYTREPIDDTVAWYFTAIDFHTGETVFKQLAGTGRSYNNHYSGLYLGSDGTAYVGVLGGMVALRDTSE